MSFIGELRKIAGDKDLNWKDGGCPHVRFKIDGIGYTVFKRYRGYQLNVEGKPVTPRYIVSTPATILRRLRSKISSEIVK